MRRTISNKEVSRSIKDTQVSDLTFPAGFHKAAGIYFEDIEGNRYIDFSSGYGVANIGWQHPKMLKAMHEQLGKSNYAPPWMATQEAAELGKKLITLTGSPGFRCLRAIGGGDANENLLKALYAYKRGEILTFDRSYHGGTHATIGMSEAELFRLPLVKHEYRTHKTEPPYCLRCSWKKNRSTCSLECALSINDILNKNKNIVAFFAEPVLGSGGIIVPPDGYFKIVCEICKEHGVTLVFDEVLTGFGRTGKMFAYQKYGVEIDGMSVAKGLSSGYAAIGAAILKDDLLGPYRKYDDVSASFAWTPMACRVALTNIQIIEEEKLPENAALTGDYLYDNILKILNRYGEEYLGEVRACGLMIGVEWVNNKTGKTPNPMLTMKFLVRMLRKGLMWCASWDYHTMIALPPLIITMPECDDALNIIEDAARETFRKSI
jgi:4-aminobutyrate aminotransferase-like enzyme